MKISTKLFLNLSIITFVLLLLGIYLGYVALRVYELVEEVEKLPDLQAQLSSVTIQHYEWAEALSAGTILMGKPFTKAIDPTKCDLGKWYYSHEPHEEVRDAFSKIEDPHKKFHATAEKILNALNSGNIELAKKIYQNETLPNLKETQEALTEMRSGLNEIVNKDIKNIAELMIELRNIIFVAFAGIIIFTLIFTYIFLIKPINYNFKNLIDIAENVSKGDFTWINKK